METSLQINNSLPSSEFFEDVKQKARVFLKKQFSTQNSKVDFLFESFKNILQQIQPQYTFCITPVTKKNKKGLHTKFGIVESKMLAHLLPDDSAENYLVFLVSTLGELSYLEDTNIDLGYKLLLDALVNEVLENYTNSMDSKYWAKETEKNLQSSLRFSPGYCDWKLENQKLIFSVLANSRNRVYLNEYSIMSPVKSISAVALLSEKLKAVVPCSFCSKDCSSRRER